MQCEGQHELMVHPVSSLSWAAYVWTYVILPATPWSKHNYCPIFTDEETETGRDTWLKACGQEVIDM